MWLPPQRVVRSRPANVVVDKMFFFLKKKTAQECRFPMDFQKKNHMKACFAVKKNWHAEVDGEKSACREIDGKTVAN